MAERDGYRAYLLRLWQDPGAGSTRWRASLEDSRTGIRLGFSSIARLHDFLLDQTGEASQAPGDDLT